MPKRPQKGKASQPQSKRKGPNVLVTSAQLLAAEALFKFKPRKSDALSYVFIGLDGKRLSKSSTRKGVMVYVNKKLHKEPLEKHGPKVTPRRQTSYNLLRKRKGRATAIAKWFPDLKDRKKKLRSKKSAFSHSSALRTLTPTPKERGSVNYLRFARQFASDFRKFSGQSRSAGTYVIYASVTIIHRDGFVETFNTEVLYGLSSSQKKFGLSEYENFANSTLYAAIAQELKTRDMVTLGSATHIRNLSANRGESREDWVDRKGFEWQKVHHEVVKVVKMETIIKQVKRTSGKAKPYAKKKGVNKRRRNK